MEVLIFAIVLQQLVAHAMSEGLDFWLPVVD
jgi:hypothetical protein